MLVMWQGASLEHNKHDASKWKAKNAIRIFGAHPITACYWLVSCDFEIFLISVILIFLISVILLFLISVIVIFLISVILLFLISMILIFLIPVCRMPMVSFTYEWHHTIFQYFYGQIICYMLWEFTNFSLLILMQTFVVWVTNILSD